MPLVTALESSRLSVPDCFFAGLIDLEMGLMIGLTPEGRFTQDEIDHLAATAVAYFQSPAATKVRSEMRKLFDETGDAPISEVMIVNNGTSFTFHRLPGEAGLVALFAIKIPKDPAAFLAASRNEAEKLASVDMLA